MKKLLEFLGMPPDYSLNGHEVDALNAWVHWLMLVLFVGWAVFFAITLIKFRRGRNPRANYRGVTTHYNTYAEVAVIVAEALLLVGLSIPAWAKRSDDFPNPNEAIQLRVLAEQFAWNIHYPGPDGKFGRTKPDLIDVQTNPIGLDHGDPAAADDICTINQLHIPAGKPIIARLTSKDVIHCFSLPVLRVKQDIIPGQEIPVYFTATETGKFHVACAQLCGLGHYRMRGFLNIQTVSEFDSWMAAEVEKAQAAKSGGGDDFWD